MERMLKIHQAIPSQLATPMPLVLRVNWKSAPSPFIVTLSSCVIGSIFRLSTMPLAMGIITLRRLAPFLPFMSLRAGNGRLAHC